MLNVPWALPQRRKAGYLRGLARVVLASWLFTLAVCSFGDLFQSAADPVGATAVAPEQFGNSEHGYGAKDEDVCCTIGQHLPTFFKLGNVDGPAQHLMYVLLPSLFLVQTALLVASGIRFSGTPPPGNPSPLLTTNALWPNAPPR